MFMMGKQDKQLQIIVIGMEKLVPKVNELEKLQKIYKIKQ
jgi:L-lactate utilization protein LutB